MKVLKAERQSDCIEPQQLQAPDNSCKVLGYGILTPQAVEHRGAIVEAEPVDALQQGASVIRSNATVQIAVCLHMTRKSASTIHMQRSRRWRCEAKSLAKARPWQTRLRIP